MLTTGRAVGIKERSGDNGSGREQVSEGLRLKPVCECVFYYSSSIASEPILLAILVFQAKR
jgi:hypothetical protein